MPTVEPLRYPRGMVSREPGSPAPPEERPPHRSERWIVLSEGRRERWGGDLRRQHIFAQLAERTGAVIEDSWGIVAIRHGVDGGLWRVRRHLPHRGPRPRLVSAEMLNPYHAEVAAEVADPVAVAVYDAALAQAHALGITLTPEREAQLRDKQAANVAAFRWQVAPTASFATLAGLDPARLIVGGNGTRVDRVRPGPWPQDPAIGLVSGGAPGRGIEALIDAARLVRAGVPRLRLMLWLIGTGESSDRYIEDLRAATAGEPWIELGAAPYGRLGEELARATVLCIPHPANEYMDVALPVKLFDSMAAGRPLVVTPRRETAAIVARQGVGLIADGDRVEDLAAALERVVTDDRLARQLGARARQVAEQDYDWRIVGRRIADEVLRREMG
jgi:glycosyltransferase involved in cell wall biosynthesis